MATLVLRPTFQKPGSGQTHGPRNQINAGGERGAGLGLGSSAWGELPWRPQVPQLKSSQETLSLVSASFCLLCSFSIELGLPGLSTKIHGGPRWAHEKLHSGIV